METIQKIDGGFLPENEVSILRRRFAEDYEELSDIAQDIDDLHARYDILQTTKDLKSTDNTHLLIIEKCDLFYSLAKRVMRRLKNYVIPEDREKFNTSWEILKDRTNAKLYNRDEVDELCDFLLSAMKNSNLVELARKSREDEFLDEIDLMAI